MLHLRNVVSATQIPKRNAKLQREWRFGLPTRGNVAQPLRGVTVGPAPLQKCVGDFCCIIFGGFCRGFSWRIFLGSFSHENEEKQSGEKIRGGPKSKIREKSVLPKTDPTNCNVAMCYARDGPCSKQLSFVMAWLYYRDSESRCQKQIPQNVVPIPPLHPPSYRPNSDTFISRDISSDSSAKLFRACFCGVSQSYRAICCKIGYRTESDASV